MRQGVTAALLNQILTTLAPMGHPAMANFLGTQLADTPDLTLARLAARLAHFTGPVVPGPGLLPGLALAPGNIVANQFNGLYQSLNQRVNNNTMSAAARDWIKHAYKLMPHATQAAMLGFLGSAAVLGTLNAAPAINAAHWLYQLARQHAGAPPAGFAAHDVVVMAGGAAQTIRIDNAIIVHVLQRHSYEHFRLTPAIINRHPTSAMFIGGMGAAQVDARLTATLSRPAFAAAHPWPLGADIQVGAVQLRLVWNAAGHYEVAQYFIAVAPGLAHNVTSGVLTEVRNRFPWMVY